MKTAFGMEAIGFIYQKVFFFYFFFSPSKILEVKKAYFLKSVQKLMCMLAYQRTKDLAVVFDLLENPPLVPL